MRGHNLMRIRADILRRAAASLRRDRKGSVAVIFAVALVPVLIAAGVGIDMTRALASRQNLQDALDSTALALAHMPSDSTQDDLEAEGDKWLQANLNDKALGAVDLDVVPGQGEIVLNASSSVPTTLTALAGFTTFPVVAHSTVKWGVGHVEVALVLDNTGSMEGKKLTSLVAAGKSLVKTLLASNTAAEPDAVKIAIVPFSNTVNIGSSYSNQTWMDSKAEAYAGTSADIFSTNPYNGQAIDRFTLYSNLKVNWAGCVEARPRYVNGVEKNYDISDETPSPTAAGTRIVPMFAPDEPDDQKWGGDLYANNYLDDATSSSQFKTKQGNPAKYYPTTVSCGRRCTTTKDPELTGTPSSNFGPNYGCAIAPVQRLTTDKTVLDSLLDKMVATGNTNVPIGLFWGWMALKPGQPFGDGVAYNKPDVTKIVIVLTDGANQSGFGSYVNQENQSLYSGLGYAWQKLLNTAGASNMDSVLDDREAKICANMKAKGVVIYAVPMEVTDKTAKKVLQGCASSAENYLAVDKASDLEATFNQIAGSIGNLRIAQ
jgi:Flp pilus assembly protein TadG